MRGVQYLGKGNQGRQDASCFDRFTYNLSQAVCRLTAHVATRLFLASPSDSDIKVGILLLVQLDIVGGEKTRLAVEATEPPVVIGELLNHC
jgi:hypothetical protein